MNVISSEFTSTVNKNKTIEAIATQNKTPTTTYQSKVVLDFIYLNVRSIQNIEGIRIKR